MLTRDGFGLLGMQSHGRKFLIALPDNEINLAEYEWIALSSCSQTHHLFIRYKIPWHIKNFHCVGIELSFPN
jgi:hypothetical protein